MILSGAPLIMKAIFPTPALLVGRSARYSTSLCTFCVHYNEQIFTLKYDSILCVCQLCMQNRGNTKEGEGRMLQKKKTWLGAAG